MAFLGSNTAGDWAVGDFWGPLGNETRAWLDHLATGAPTVHTTPEQARFNLETTIATIARWCPAIGPALRLQAGGWVRDRTAMELRTAPLRPAGTRLCRPPSASGTNGACFNEEQVQALDWSPLEWSEHAC